jgi:hypothetical protein
VLAPELRRDGDALLAFLDREAEEHGRSPTEILEAVVSVLRRAAAMGWTVDDQPNKEVHAWTSFKGIFARAQRAAGAAQPPPAEARVASASDLVQLDRIKEILLRQDLTADEKCTGVGSVLDAARAVKSPTAPPATAAAAAQPQPQTQPQPAATPKGPSEVAVEAACDWLRTPLGTTWHNSQRLKGAAKEAGISREACLAAMERVERQTIRGPNYQWITAMPGTPLPMADDGDIIGTIRAADHNCLVANRLYHQGAQPLLAYVRSQAEKHGCTQGDVIGVILDVLRLASSPECGARQKTLELMIGPNCGVSKLRHDVTRWADFNRVIADGIQRKEKTAA